MLEQVDAHLKKPYTTYEDLYALEGTIQNKRNLVINLQDSNTNLASQFNYWSGQWNL
jgi:hypothetical protein